MIIVLALGILVAALFVVSITTPESGDPNNR
jgi:hypothetical protein